MYNDVIEVCADCLSREASSKYLEEKPQEISIKELDQCNDCFSINRIKIRLIVLFALKQAAK